VDEGDDRLRVWVPLLQLVDHDGGAVPGPERGQVVDFARRGLDLVRLELGAGLLDLLGQVVPRRQRRETQPSLVYTPLGLLPFVLAKQNRDLAFELGGQCGTLGAHPHRALVLAEQCDVAHVACLPHQLLQQVRHVGGRRTARALPRATR
jgi:hypothetical protein